MSAPNRLFQQSPTVSVPVFVSYEMLRDQLKISELEKGVERIEEAITAHDERLDGLADAISEIKTVVGKLVPPGAPLEPMPLPCNALQISSEVAEALRRAKLRDAQAIVDLNGPEPLIEILRKFHIARDEEKARRLAICIYEGVKFSFDRNPPGRGEKRQTSADKRVQKAPREESAVMRPAPKAAR